MPTVKLKGSDYIYERISDDGRLTSYQVKIRRKNFPDHNCSFDDLDEARRFVRTVLSDQDRGHRVDRLASHRTSVGEVIDQAIASITNGRRQVKGAISELYRLKAFRRDYEWLCNTALADATEVMFEDWLFSRLEDVKPGTALRDVRLLKPIFATAARRYDLKMSPIAFLKTPRVLDERIRRITEEEESLLFAELRKSVSLWVPVAAEFALHTSIRRGEQLMLAWQHYKPTEHKIWLPEGKNGRGRDIVLTVRAQEIVEALPGRQDGGYIFKTTGSLLKQAFENARQRAARGAHARARPDLATVGTLRWHHFRHEAVSRLFDAGWPAEQVMDFSGHVDTKSLLRYRHPKTEQTVARLRAAEARRQPIAQAVPGTLEAGLRSGRFQVSWGQVDSEQGPT